MSRSKRAPIDPPFRPGRTTGEIETVPGQADPIFGFAFGKRIAERLNLNHERKAVMTKTDERKILAALASNQCKEALDAGVTLTHLLDAGATLTQLRNAGATWTQKDIPILKKPYSRMLAAIRAKKLIHDQ